MEKRTIIALVLIFVIFWLSNELIWKRSAPEPAPAPIETIDPLESYPDEDRVISDRVPPQDRDIMIEGEEEKFEIPDIEINDNIRLENDLMMLVFSNRGAVLRSVLLKDYDHYDRVNPVSLIPENEYLLGLEVETIEEFLTTDDLVFNWEKSEIRDHQVLTFYLSSQGVRVIEKRYTIDSDYALYKDLILSGLDGIRSYSLSFSSGIADTEESVRNKETDYRFFGQIQNERRNIQLRRLNDTQIIRGNVDWAAIRSKYFIMAMIPEQRILTDRLEVFSHEESPAFNLSVVPNRVVSDLHDRYEIYLGPLDYTLLSRYNIGLEETVEMGWRVIRPLSRLFLWLLSTLNSLFNNYGVTIIFFALILKIVLYPLTHKSFSSTHKMQKVQPHMQEIQRQYKSDPKQMQLELRKLYKEHGVNPLGGCFPLLLQMPIFFALYPVLRYSIELRQASFMFWLNDLSEPDPYMILPILMGLFMFLQQRLMMPKNINKEEMDEKQLAQMQSQRMMMYIMPVILVFIFRSLPSGLVLYWTVFNIFSIIQQYFIMKTFNR